MLYYNNETAMVADEERLTGLAAWLPGPVHGHFDGLLEGGHLGRVGGHTYGQCEALACSTPTTHKHTAKKTHEITG